MRRILLVLLLLAACGLPRDPEATLQRVSGGVIRAGFTEAHPWATGDPSDPSGVEIDLVEDFAESIGAAVEWTKGSEAELVKALEVRALDLVVGGFDAKDPWIATTGMTRPYAKTRLVVGAEPGASLPSLEGREIAAEEASEAVGLLRKANATVKPVPDLDGAGPFVALDDWLLDDLGLSETGHVLAETEHVMATPLGENAFLVALERYLHKHAGDIAATIREVGP